jgi:2'-5' RNA ligase
LRDLGAVAGDVRIAWSVNRIVLFRSHTERTGSRYEELCNASLRG